MNYFVIIVENVVELLLFKVFLNMLVVILWWADKPVSNIADSHKMILFIGRKQINAGRIYLDLFRSIQTKQFRWGYSDENYTCNSFN